MKKFIAGFLLYGLSVVAFAQDKAPEIPDKNRAAILAVQLHIEQFKNQAAQLQGQLQQVNEEYQKAAAQLQIEGAKACAAVKVDCGKDYSINYQTLQLEKRPASKNENAPKKN